MLKKLTFLLCLIGLNGISTAQNGLYQPGWQLNVGVSTALQRWDNDMDSLSSFFNGDAATGVPAQPMLRVYSKPQFNLEVNYIHNLQNRFSWKLGALASKQQLGYTLGNSYVDSASVSITSAGIQGLALLAAHPTEGSIITLGIGASVQYVGLNNSAFYTRNDTLINVGGLLDVSAVSTLSMNRSSSVLLQGLAQLEWINKLNENWSISASIQGRMPLSNNYNYSSNSTVTGKIDFFGQSISTPVSVTRNTSAFGMPYMQFNVGIVRMLEMRRMVVPEKAL
ncbi:MAG: hypothetical protein RLZZ543_1295 [Bacteroidota bacterium]|jgi:hypothetical protein